MMPLKTLKNIATCPDCKCIDYTCVDYELLKQEAIKHIKNYNQRRSDLFRGRGSIVGNPRDHKSLHRELDLLEGGASSLKVFFNITESDLEATEKEANNGK